MNPNLKEQSLVNGSFFLAIVYFKCLKETVLTECTLILHAVTEMNKIKQNREKSQLQKKMTFPHFLCTGLFYPFITL